MIKNALLNLLTFFISTFLFSQSANHSIRFKDFHSVPVTEALLSSSGTMISADASGKILEHKIAPIDYHMTIRPGKGSQVSSMRLIRNDSVLLVSQRAHIIKNSQDSLIAIRRFDNKVIFTKAISFDFIGNSEKYIYVNSIVNNLYTLEVFNLNFEPVSQIPTKADVLAVTFDQGLNSCFYVETKGINGQDLVIYNTGEKQEKGRYEIPYGEEIIELYSRDKKLYAVQIHSEKKLLKIREINPLDGSGKDLFTTDYYLGRFVNVKTSLSEDKSVIAISSQSSIPYKPVVLQMEDGRIQEIIPDLERGSTLTIPVSDGNSVVYFEPYYTSSLTHFGKYDLTEDRIEVNYPSHKGEFYSGMFMGNDDWMVFGTELEDTGLISAYNYHVKYYQKGTLNNRFGRLLLNDYLEVKHSVSSITSYRFNVDPAYGDKIFYGYSVEKDGNNAYGYFRYDFFNDKIERIADEQNDYRQLMDYANGGRQMLLAYQLYTNGGVTEPAPLALLTDGKLNELKGRYKFGKLSQDGRFILLIDKNNRASLLTSSNLKTIFETALKDGQYELMRLGETGFVIGNSYYEIDFNTCNVESHFLVVDEPNEVFHKKQECVLVTDTSFSNDSSALIIDKAGVLLGETLIPFDIGHFPVSCSLNADASRLMLSFNNGLITVIDTGNLKELGAMLHPDKSSHVFLDKNGNYFSNINPLLFLHFDQTDAESLSNLVNEKLNPDLVLKNLFGHADPDYLKTLQKAMALRRSNEVNEKEQQQIGSSESSESELYLLSIGVSDYQDSDYDLTFADKDAMDMARIYGTLSEEELQTYYDRFHGMRIGLFDESENKINETRVYEGTYQSLQDLYSVSPDGRYWVENKFGKYLIYDMIEGRRDSLKLPAGFNTNSYALTSPFLAAPDKSGFYLGSDFDFFFDFENKSFVKNKSAFDPDERPYYQVVPLENGRWMRYATKSESGKEYILLDFAGVDTSSIQVDLSKFEIIKSDGTKEVTDDAFIYNPAFKAVSSNGRHLLYSDGDSYYYYDIEKNERIPRQLPWTKGFEYGIRVFISNDGTLITTLENGYENFRYRIRKYTISGERVFERSFQSEEEVKGFSISEDGIRFIKVEAPLVSVDLFDQGKVLETSAPASFSTVHVKKLINAEANSEVIKEQLNNFFKSAKPQDQVMVFLAGHGVLNEELNYYFAPYDMDFQSAANQGISFQTIIEALNATASRNKLLLMDSCHSGNTLDLIEGTVPVTAKAGEGKRGSKGKSTKNESEFKVSEVVGQLFQDFLSTSGVTIISASSGGDVAYEQKSLGNGAFTASYLEVLESRLKGNSYILEESQLKTSIELRPNLVTEILKSVMLKTDGKQAPDLREFDLNASLKMW